MTAAAAKVAWPHSGTSLVGVNHLNPKVSLSVKDFPWSFIQITQTDWLISVTVEMSYLGEVASLRDIHFSGNLLFLLIREIFFQEAHGGWVTAERLPGEGIHCPEWNLHVAGMLRSHQEAEVTTKTTQCVPVFPVFNKIL